MLRSIRHRFKPQEVSRELGALAGKDMEELTSDDILAIRGVYKRFRVLVLGPANAGKTTLLERLSDSPAGAATVTRDGRRIPEVPRGYSQRGAHRITDEITYASNPGFVFHDSGGFEAGADDEIKAVWNFIRKRSSGSPSEQLHAIWLCIPADNSRPFGFLHSGFFSKPTGSVPVIGVFTKLDGRETIELVNLLGADPSPSDIFQSHSRVQQRTTNFIEELQTQFQRLPVPPTAFIRLGNMHKNTEESTAACTQLLQITTDALPTGTLKLLLRITVRNKLRRVKTTTMLQRVLKEAEVQGLSQAV
ncbi:hypothetical protein BS47DRAFT_1395344 [Hydnum rufescens UP504]|uniref:G domain-containing protein n=1 Tax=Hydnum rufescens UP504 TaxID=1448309 RepID=A0A9P6ASM3_9AGAM|nr:hypothetical protein BS47DRAFT_1395344 [Hydnum rufescens UP504]